MFGSQTLDVAIGIVFVYLLLSLICSVVNEWVAGILAMRSKNLEAGIRNLLNDPQGTGIAQGLYNHPLIKGLSREGGKPSYIPPRTFVLALMDIVAPADPTGPKAFAQVRNTVANLPAATINVDTQKVLLALIDEAGGDLKKTRKNIEVWFNDSMDRVSGWYKRKAQLFVVVWALLVTLSVNADTIMVTNSLSRDATLRASIVAVAQETAKRSSPTDPASSEILIKGLQKEVKQLELPIGWSTVEGDPRQVPSDLGSIIMKILGLLITATAVSLGAPFWFDMLNKLVSIRSVGKKP